MFSRRREFPAAVKRAAWLRSAGWCKCGRVTGRPSCGAALGPGNVFYEHIIQDGIGGEPILSNCACLTKTCWQTKTYQHDLPIVADTKRLWDRHRGIKTVSQRIPGGRFDSRKRKMNGRVVDRATGQAWGTR